MRRVVGTVVFVGVNLVVVLALLEWGVRAFTLIPDHVLIRYRVVAGDEVIAPVPHAAGSSVFGIPFRSDALGLRGPERAVAKAPGTRRIAVVGDSVVWGQGVAEDDALVAQLERLLRATEPAAEVWDLGVPATNTFNHAARFARLAPLLRPDATAVVLLYDDLAPGPVRYRVTTGGSLAVPGRAAPFPDAWRPRLERVALYWVLPRLLRRRTWQAEPDPLMHFPAMTDRLDALRATADAIGSRFVVALMPGRYPPADEYRRLETKLAAYAEPRGIPFLSLGNVLGNPARPELLLSNDSTHPNAAGHRLIAEALAPLVR